MPTPKKPNEIASLKEMLEAHIKADELALASIEQRLSSIEAMSKDVAELLRMVVELRPLLYKLVGVIITAIVGSIGAGQL